MQKIFAGALYLVASAVASAAEPPARPFSVPFPISRDETGYAAIFDGKSLGGWEGEAKYWRVENGAIVGEATPKAVLKGHNSFLVWRGGTVRDFDLRLQYRITPEGNSGVNYRSSVEPQWAMRGYQFDIEGREWSKMFSRVLSNMGLKVPSQNTREGVIAPPDALRVTGQNYDELGRHVLALPGQVTEVRSDGRAHVIGFSGADDLIEKITTDDWNDAGIVARGNVFIHLVNDRVVSIVVDSDATSRHDEGFIGLQIHAGAPMRVEYRNIRLKTY